MDLNGFLKRNSSHSKEKKCKLKLQQDTNFIRKTKIKKVNITMYRQGCGEIETHCW